VRRVAYLGVSESLSMVSTMVYVHTILRDVAGLFKVVRLVAYDGTNSHGELLAMDAKKPGARKRAPGLWVG
ncbi:MULTISPECIES: hypothetical protein, partial [Acidovorax]|uniref:hypothetical protein n=1 Tax=Acidovorax TaxID=12916 RepID=UPI0006E53B34